MHGKFTRRELLVGAAAAPAIASATQAVPASADPSARQIDTQINAQINTQIDELFSKYTTQSGAPGAAIGVWQGGRTLYARGYGLANIEEEAPNTPLTVFHVASVSKQFTAFAIALLAADGKLSLQDDVRKYLPYVPDFGVMIRGVTIRIEHLIHQISGLPDHGPYWLMSGRDFRDLTRQQPLLNLIARMENPNFAPGTEFQYTNTNYTLLAEIVEAVSGQSFREFCAERIFQPLGMTDTFFCDDVTEVVKGRAYSYRKRKDGWGRAALTFEYVGGTGLHTTVVDLTQWCGHLLRQPEAGGRSAIEMIAGTTALQDGTPVSYAFGLNHAVHNGRAYLLHTGGDAGFNTVTAYFPAEQFAVVILQNTPGEVATLARKIADIYLDNGLRKGETEQRAPESVLRAVPGRYLNRFGKLATLEAKDGALWLRWSEDSPVRLRCRAGNVFDEGETLYAKYRFELDARGQCSGFVQHTTAYGDVQESFHRVAAFDPARLRLQELVGDYRNSMIETTYRLQIEAGKLTARSMWSAAPIVYTPATLDRFDSPDLAMAVIEFKRDERGEVVGFVAHSSRTRNVWFGRVRDTKQLARPVAAS